MWCLRGKLIGIEYYITEKRIFLLYLFFKILIYFIFLKIESFKEWRRKMFVENVKLFLNIFISELNSMYILIYNFI